MEPANIRAASERQSAGTSRFWKIVGTRLEAALASSADLGRRMVPNARARATLALGAHLLTLGITTYVFLVLNKRFYYATQAQYDEQFFVWGGWSIRKGLVPYRDFLEFKPPMVFITHAFAQTLFGFADLGYRKFFTLVPLLSLLLLQGSLIARGVGRLLSMTVVLGIVVLFVSPTWHDTALTDCESIGLTYYILGLALFLWEGRGIKVTTVLGGIFMACCVLSKEPFAPVVGFTWLGMFWLRGKPRPDRESVRQYALYSLLGVAILIVALCIYMIPTGSMKAYLTLVRNYSVIYRDPKRSYCVALGVAHPTTPLGDLRVAWGKITLRFLNLSVLGYLTPIVVPGAIFAFRRAKLLFAIMVLALIGALWAFTATNCHWMHYFNMSMAGVIFVLCAGADSMKARPAEEGGEGGPSGPLTAGRLVRAGACVAGLFLLVSHSGPDFAKQRSAEYHRQAWQEPIPGILAFIQQNTTPTDRIFTTGTPLLYAKADRISAARESGIIDDLLGSYDGTTDEERLRPIRQQLDRNRPKVVVLDPEHVWLKGRTYRALVLPFLAELKYQKVRENLYLRP
jgi:hypothetical protein